jgi:hypothetical protein
MTEKEDRMRRAYGVSGKLFRERLAQDRPDDADELSRIESSEVVVVRGQYDHMHRVLEASQVPFLHLRPSQLTGADWDRMQVLLINCPGHLPVDALDRIAPWVREGGYLLTTDWALKHVIESAFPGTIRHNGQQSADCVVRVQATSDGDDPLLEGFLEDDREPLWWLETASYPIEVLDSGRVRVLMRSGEVGQRLGSDPIVVTFDEGEGTVLHMMSHLYLQRGDVRDQRDAQPAMAYMAQELNVADVDLERFAEAASDLNAAEVGAAMGKQRILTNQILTRRKKGRARKEGS